MLNEEFLHTSPGKDRRSKVRRIYRSVEEQRQDDMETVTNGGHVVSPSLPLHCAFHIEDALSDSDLLQLDELRHRIPLDLSRPTCPRRFLSEKHLYLVGDTDAATAKPMHKEDGWVGRLVDANLARWDLLGHRGKNFQSLPWFRFLEYSEGGHMAIHTDGTNLHPGTGARSVATMMIYLSTCDEGGETTLYHKVEDPTITKGNKQGSKHTTVPLEHVAPIRNTVLIFPHSWQHSGDRVQNAAQPKIALRVDLCLAPSVSARSNCDAGLDETFLVPSV
jgi:hypothetical protein